MNHSIYSADRATHLKVVVVALVAGIMVAGLGITARVTAGDNSSVSNSLQLSLDLTEIFTLEAAWQLVDIDTGRGPMLQPSCMVPVAPGMVVDTQSPAARRAQEGIIELLLANHPLDCPVCDKGGECPLQNQAMSVGRTDTRFDGDKRLFDKPVNINAEVLLDRERCVSCARCTRFAEQMAAKDRAIEDQQAQINDANAQITALMEKVNALAELAAGKAPATRVNESPRPEPQPGAHTTALQAA